VKVFIGRARVFGVYSNMNSGIESEYQAGVLAIEHQKAPGKEHLSWC
jgi:hypothetical protein